MVKRAFIDSRPYLLLSLIFGISYFFIRGGAVPGLFEILWKGAGVGFLSIYAFHRNPAGDGRLLGSAMALYAIGDMLIELDVIAGGVAFMCGHMVAIILFARNRRQTLTFSQKAFAVALVPSTILIAWAMAYQTGEGAAIALYAAFVSVMAAMAWTSVFPRYRVGAGAVLFVASDLLLFAHEGVWANSAVPALLVWPFYYFGQFLICTGVIQRLRRRLP